ncbi:hypothetical protein HKD37_17G048557 [Glycine soja]
MTYMDEDQCMYENIMSKEVDMDYENEQECGVNEPHVDCSDAFNTSQVFGTRDDVLQWARSVSHENIFVAVIMRKKEFVRRDTGSRKCGCPFKLRGKLVIGGQSWMVKLIYGIHNHELAKSLVGHPYAGRLTKDEKTIIADMTKSMVKPRNILLTLKEHNANSCTTIKQIYNARSAYRSSIRGNNTYKTNRYRLPLLDFVGVTPTGMTFFARRDSLPVVIVTDRDLTLMNAVKNVFSECTNLLCRFHIDKNVKAKYKSLIGQKNA